MILVEYLLELVLFDSDILALDLSDRLLQQAPTEGDCLGFLQRLEEMADIGACFRGVDEIEPARVWPARFRADNFDGLPVIKAASSLQINTARAAISSGFAMRPIG